MADRLTATEPDVTEGLPVGTVQSYPGAIVVLIDPAIEDQEMRKMAALMAILDTMSKQESRRVLDYVASRLGRRLTGEPVPV